jgi:RND family efflux transporter MFP subunit
LWHFPTDEKGIPMRVPSFASRLGSLLLLAGFIAAAGCEDKHPTPVEAPAPLVEVARPLERVVTDHEVFTARTQAVESVNVKARATGYLNKIAFTDGKEVEKEQLLFEIDPRPYQDQLDIAKGNVARLEGQKQLLKVQVDRYTKLVAKGAASQQDLDVYVGQAAENTGALQAARAQVTYAELNLSFCSVTAAIAGRIDRHFVNVGDLVTADTTVLTNIVSLKPTWAYFNVDQNTATRYQELVRAGKVKSALTNQIPVRMGVGGGDTYPIEGVIDFVANQLDPNTGSIQLRAVFPNGDGTLSAGLFGRIQVPISAEHKALLVRDSAIGTNQDKKYVLVVNDQNVVEYHIVNVGLLHGELREVLPYRQVQDTDAQGKPSTRQVRVLSAADRVIVDGLQRVRPGSTVNPVLINMLTELPEKK